MRGRKFKAASGTQGMGQILWWKGLEEGGQVLLMPCLRSVLGKDGGVIFIVHVSFPSLSFLLIPQKKS